MFPVHQKSSGPSATELLEATRKEYVKTEALKTAKIDYDWSVADPGRPRIFSRNGSDQEDEDVECSVAPSRTSLSRSRIRVAPSRSPDFLCFCLTSTPGIRPSSYKPLETPYGAFRRVEKPHTVTLSRTKSTPPRAQPRPPPPRPPKPQWLRNSLAKRISNEPNDSNNNNKATSQAQISSSLFHQKPIPAPRLSKQILKFNVCRVLSDNMAFQRRQTMPIPMPLERRESCDATANMNNEFDILRVSTCSTGGNMTTAKTIESLTTTPSTSRGTVSSYGGRYTRERRFHNASCRSHHNADLNRRSPETIPSVITSSAIAEERSTAQSVELSQIGSEASVFTSITAAYHGSCSMDDLTKGSASDCDNGSGLMVGLGSHRSGPLGAEPSLIEKNARVIKWIYSCRTVVA
ncbi:unnamed protein product [Anisakis simplex]|uniref:FAM110_C domain-containing protein n=1 Tax=Anisakis simplex TaxID=6269 RepID=A0A0M3K1Y9_ANISI|nr:unnamed protein product [Anisakis simplex]